MTKYRFIIQRYSTFIEDYIDEDSGNVVSIRRPDKLLGTYYTSMFLPSIVRFIISIILPIGILS